jgi:hypothetical protein
MRKKTVFYKILVKREKLAGLGSAGMFARISNWKYPKIGEWTPKIYKKDLVMCRTGYHLTTAKDVAYWINKGYYLFIAEGRGRAKGRKTDNKILFSQVRLIKCLGRVTSYKQADKIDNVKTDAGLRRCFPKRKRSK